MSSDLMGRLLELNKEDPSPLAKALGLYSVAIDGFS